ncbi:MAG: dependent ligase [Deltaproteobacteria bacterium]|nr:dependent ligase [Deltaproteobacteria bacterium]
MRTLLREYAAKREFEKTPEPTPGLRPSGDRLMFVVHKHAARALHYDLRLELEGVLKSWAVPKGPSLDPSLKRLAVAVTAQEASSSGTGGFIITLPREIKTKARNSFWTD